MRRDALLSGLALLLAVAACRGSPADPERARLEEARAAAAGQGPSAALAASLALAEHRIAQGESDAVRSELVPAIRTARAAGLVREETRATFLLAQACACTGDAQRALALLARVYRLVVAQADPQLALAYTRAATPLARRLGDHEAAYAWLGLAAAVNPEGFQTALAPRAFTHGEIPALPPMPPSPREPVRVEPDVDRFSQRIGVEAFYDRVEKEPGYLADLSRLKAYRESHRVPFRQRLEEPEVRYGVGGTWGSDYRAVAEVYGYYRFVLKLSRSIDDGYGLAVLYTNQALAGEFKGGVLSYGYTVGRVATIATAVSRIVRFAVTGPALDLTILAMEKAMIDLIRRHEREQKADELRHPAGVRRGLRGAPDVEPPPPAPAPPSAWEAFKAREP